MESWKVGDTCWARWNDGKFYHAKIVRLDGDHAVVFYSQSEQEVKTNLHNLSRSKPDANTQAAEDLPPNPVNDEARKALRAARAKAKARSKLRSDIHSVCALPPVTEVMQHLVLYETKSRFYVVGSNLSQSKFRMLKLDRTDCTGLSVAEDPTVYSKSELDAMLTMIDGGNKHNGGLTKCLTAFGIIGFIRFLEGFYVQFITQIRKVGVIGGHVVYTIQDTTLIPLTHPTLSFAAGPNFKRDEARYKSLFSQLDLTKNFYFSYTYDLTRSLQFNMIHARQPRLPPKDMYVWNHFLLENFRTMVPNPQWVVPCIHGFFEQTQCSVFGRILTLTLMSRRSRFFAGTRYLKRGINEKGQVANDVESEQILHDRESGSHVDGQFTSHVQLRASIPLFWSQESNPMIAKPAIVVQKVDPLFLGTRRHFQDLFRRYGSPVLALNLVRKHERRRRESIIGEGFEEAVVFLNQFLPREHKIDFYAWDFKLVSKSKTVSVVDELAIIAHWALQRTGLFHSTPHPDAVATTPENTLHVGPTKESVGITNKGEPMRRIAFLQRGIARSNCIDSLDRTNVAQFCIGKCALGYQLYAMGVMDSCVLHSSSELLQILLDMYERMGDCLAMQYGGSQMHRQMKKDRGKSVTMPVLYRNNRSSTKPKEMFVSLMRHYQNSFQDTGKQDAINLLLGYFIPPRLGPAGARVPKQVRSDDDVVVPHIWELTSDYYLHNAQDQVPFEEDILGTCRFDKTDWYEEPIAAFEATLRPPPVPTEALPAAAGFEEVYHPTDMSYFDELCDTPGYHIHHIHIKVKHEQPVQASFGQRLRNKLLPGNASVVMDKRTKPGKVQRTLGDGTAFEALSGLRLRRLLLHLAMPKNLAFSQFEMKKFMERYVHYSIEDNLIPPELYHCCPRKVEQVLETDPAAELPVQEALLRTDSNDLEGQDTVSPLPLSAHASGRNSVNNEGGKRGSEGLQAGRLPRSGVASNRGSLRVTLEVSGQPDIVLSASPQRAAAEVSRGDHSERANRSRSSETFSPLPSARGSASSVSPLRPRPRSVRGSASQPNVTSHQMPATPRSPARDSRLETAPETPKRRGSWVTGLPSGLSLGNIFWTSPTKERPASGNSWGNMFSRRNVQGIAQDKGHGASITRPAQAKAREVFPRGERRIFVDYIHRSVPSSLPGLLNEAFAQARDPSLSMPAPIVLEEEQARVYYHSYLKDIALH